MRGVRYQEKTNLTLRTSHLALLTAALLLLISVLCSPTSGGTFNATWTFANSTNAAHGVKVVYIQPIAPYGVEGGTIITSDRLKFSTGSNSSITISNLVNGRCYRLQFIGPFIDTTMTNCFDTNVTGTVNAADVPYIAAPLRDGATVAWSQLASDGRYLRTNQIPGRVRPGTNVVFFTNADLSITISSTTSATNVGTTEAVAGTGFASIATNGGLFTVSVPLSITNGLATTNYVNAALATNGVPGVSANSGIVATTNGSGVVTLSLYVSPAIASFANNQNSVEIGATVTSTILDWTLSGGEITSQSLNQGIGSLAIGLRTYTDPADYSTDRTYTLTVSDGTTTPTANTTITFLPKRYWGASAVAALSDAQVIALTSEFATARTQTRSIITDNSYIWFAWPASFGAATFVVDGFADEGWTLTTRAFVNASGYSQSYHLYRHTLLTSGTYAVVVN